MLVDIIAECMLCGKYHSVSVYDDDFTKYEMGTLAQNAFPYLSATEREQIISGMCPTCQKSIFDR